MIKYNQNIDLSKMNVDNRNGNNGNNGNGNDKFKSSLVNRHSESEVLHKDTASMKEKEIEKEANPMVPNKSVSIQ